MKIKKIIFARVRSRFRGTDAEELKIYDTLIDDMLRYDTAFRSTVDQSIIAFPVFQTKDGDLGGRITTSRWTTFCVVVTPIEGAEHADLKFSMNPDDFVTYRHINSDYKTLVPFTLRQFERAKDLRELEKSNG